MKKAPKRYKDGGSTTLTDKPSKKVDLTRWSPELAEEAKKYALEAESNKLKTGGQSYHAFGGYGTLGLDPKTGKQYTDFSEDPNYKLVSGNAGQRVFQTSKSMPYGKNDVANPNYPNGLPQTFVEVTDKDGNRKLAQYPTATYQATQTTEVVDPMKNKTAPSILNAGTYETDYNKTKVTPQIQTTTQQPSFLTGNTQSPVVYNYAKGGIVKRLGYANGTGIGGVNGEDTLSMYGGGQGENAVASGGQGGGKFDVSQFSGMSGPGAEVEKWMEADAMGSSGRVNKKQYAAAGAIGEGERGAQMGMKYGGPWGALIGGAAGFTKGGIQNYVQANQINEGVDYGERMADADIAREEQAKKFNRDLQRQMLERQQGLAKGGVVKGKGGPKDDAIKAKVEGGSFIVPAENAHIAKQVKKMIAPSKKKEVADLDQEGETPVKLSDGEFMFTPEEKEEIISELGEEFLEAMAPNAEDEDEGMREGGLTPYKAKKMLKDGTAHGKPLSEKRRGYLGLIASGYKCGGMVKGYAEGTTAEGVSYESPEEKKYKAAQKRYSELQQEESELASSKDKSAKTRLLDVRSQRTALEKEYGFNNKSKNIPSMSGASIEKALGGGKTQGIKTSSKVGIKPEVLQSKTTELPVKLTEDVTITPTTETVTDTVTETPSKGMSKTQQDYLGKGLGIAGDVARSTGNYFLPYKQYQMGTQFLAEAGKRPQYQIDPDFNKSVTTAQANAQFGFTPEEKAIVDSRNLNALRAAQGAAQNYSGGSNAVALNLMRQAGSDYYNRGLQSALANKNLQMSKQQQANSLIADKAAMNRQIFQDSLNAWKENQAAGGALVGAGLSNALGANRLNQEISFQRQYNQGNNPWVNYNI